MVPMQSVMPPNLKDENENGCRQRGRRKAAAKRTANDPPQTEKQTILHKRLARGTTKERTAAKVTKRKRVATTLDDKDNVDQTKENPYETRAFACQWYAESGMIAEHVREVGRERRG